MDLRTLESTAAEVSVVEHLLAAALHSSNDAGLHSSHRATRSPGADRPPFVAAIDEAHRASGRSWWKAHRPAWTEAGWWEAPMLPEVRALLRLPKGPDLMAAVQRVPPPDGSPCAFPHAAPRPASPCACQVVVVAAWAAAAAWASDCADKAVLRTLGPSESIEYLNPHLPELGTLTDPGVELVAPALRRSPASLRCHLARVRARHQFPDSLRTAIAEGFLPTWQADLIAQDLADLEPAGRDLVLDTIVESLRHRHTRGLVGWTFTQIRRRARQVLAGLGDEVRRRRTEVNARRGVSIRQGGDGWSRITADLPSDVAQRIHYRLTALARAIQADDATDATQTQSSQRTMDQIRADVFSDLLLSTPHDYDGTGAPAPGREVAVVINASTLLNTDDRGAEMPGCGPIPADLARTLAADSRWRAWITDARGIVVATSPTTYTPSAAVARVVRAREPHCRMPGCRATVTDLDHVIPWPTGRTVPHNLSRLCRRHHNLKTHRQWQLSDDTPTSYMWTDPNGITHRDAHDPPLPDPPAT